MHIAEIAERIGLPVRQVRYVLDHGIMPGLKPAGEGRGTPRYLTAFGAFGVACAALLLQAGLRREVVYACLAVAVRPYTGKGRLGENPLDMAQRARAFGEALEQRGRELDRTVADVHGKLRFVERSVVFLDRLEQFLAIYDPVAAPGEEVRRYLAQLDRYIDHFDRSIKAFQALSATITAPSDGRPGSVPRPNPQPPGGGTGGRGAGPATRAAGPVQAPQGLSTPGASPPRPVAPPGVYRIRRVDGELAVLDAGSRQGLAPGQVLPVVHADGRSAGTVRVCPTIRGDDCVVRGRPGTVQIGDVVVPRHEGPPAARTAVTGAK
jgi:hypothetical protein